MIRSLRWSHRLFCFLLICDLILVALYWIGTIFTDPEYQSFTNLDGEANLAAWFSSSQILLIAVFAWQLIFSNEGPQTLSRPFLALIATGAMIWSLDETGQMHERLTRFMGDRPVDWLPRFLLSHKIIAAILIAVTFLAAHRVLKEAIALWRASRRVCLIAVSGFVICFFGGIVIETTGHKLIAADSEIIWRVQITFEEFFEMAGASLILYSISLLLNQKESHQQSAFSNLSERESAANRYESV